VLDASAVLAFLWQEAGCNRVGDCLLQGDALLSTVSATEVATKAIDRGLPAEATRELIQALEVTLVDFDFEQALLAASLRTSSRHLGLSLGDRACLALALSRKVPVLTSDRVWSQLAVDVQVECIR
jgi:PIN domain nuclease of toxin-antitoxin system